MFCVINNSKHYFVVQDMKLMDKLLEHQNIFLDKKEQVYYFNTDPQTSNILLMALRGSDMYFPYELNIDQVKGELERMKVLGLLKVFDMAAKLSSTCDSKDFKELSERVKNEDEDEEVKDKTTQPSQENVDYDEEKFGKPVDLNNFASLFKIASDAYERDRKKDVINVNMKEMIKQATAMVNSALPVDPTIKEVVEGGFDEEMMKKLKINDEESDVSSLEESDEELEKESPKAFDMMNQLMTNASEQLGLLFNNYGQESGNVKVESDDDSLPDLEYD